MPRRLATSRLVEAIETQVRHFPGVPRAVFEALLWVAPGGLTFQALSLAGLRSLSTAVGHAGETAVGSRRSPGSLGPLRRAVGAPGPLSFGSPERVSVFAPTPPATAPCPQPRDARDFPWREQVEDYMARAGIMVNRKD